MAEFQLTPAEPGDFPFIRDLVLRSRINPFGLDVDRFWLARSSSGERVGCVQLKPHGDGTLELASLAVTEPFRGQGVARILIESTLARAPRPLYLTCRSALGPFYQKFGFRILAKNEMSPYFRRLSMLANIFGHLPGVNERILVMRLDQ